MQLHYITRSLIANINDGDDDEDEKEEEFLEIST